jgi:hypothetical protein
MSLEKAAKQVRAAGRGKDTELVHFTKDEVGAMQGLAKAAGGKLTRNPKTGMLEAGFLDSMLPTILGIGANFIVPGSGMLVGGLTGALQNKDDPLLGAALGAAGGYGGGQIAAGLQGAGAGAAQAAAQEATKAAAAEGLKAGAQTALTEQGVSNLAAASNQAAAGATQDFMAKPFYEQMAGGAQAVFSNPSGFVEGMGGGMATAKAAGLAAAPGLYGASMQGGGEEASYGDGKGTKYDYDAGYTGGTMVGSDPSSERQWFDPAYTPRMAAGGSVNMSEGGFVVPADVVSMVGNGSSNAGLEIFGQLGAQPIDGAGDGQSDDIPASIDGQAPARVARQEAYLPPEVVAKMGGAKKLYDMVERVRKMAHGKTEQQRPVDMRKALV